MWFESMHPRWREWLADHRAVLDNLENRVAALKNLTPPANLVMAAFTGDPSEVKVVVLGQDPYPTPGVAIGRAFAVNTERNVNSSLAPVTNIPGSLRNIFTELAADVGGEVPDASLLGWERQGVLLLNRHLTTSEGEAGGHLLLGWDAFTEAAIRALLAHTSGLVLVLWGNQAQSIEVKLTSVMQPDRVKVVKSAHPSPLSAYRGFFGSRPFSAINAELKALGKSPINWNL